MNFRRTRSSRPLALLVSVAVAAGLLTAASVVLETPAPAQAATAKSKFNPGAIITDPLFYDFGTMSAAKIQSFLNKRVTKCSSKSQAPCLRSYKVSTSNIKAIEGRCDNDIVGKKNQTAAQIIYTVAVACEVNPQVLLVTLQKEQGLVTAKSATALDYRKAMGYGCPDTSNCDSNYYGFFKQVYWAARAYNAYFNFPGSFKQPWQTLPIQYSPNAKCGTKNVYIETRATAALYNYTPYTPNAASLANPYKTGNSCSSYGNRNFWLYFNKWFGDTSRGQYFVTSGSSTFLVAGDSRWSLTAKSSRLVSSLAGLGKSGPATSTYLKSLTNQGALSPVVRVLGDTENWYLLANGSKYKLVGCSAVQNLGFDCDVPVLPKAVLSKLPLSNDLKTATNAHVRTADGRNYLLGNGIRRQILDKASTDAAGITLGTRINIDASVIASIPVGVPIVKPGSLVTGATSGSGVYVSADASRSYTIDKTLLTQAATASWFGGVDGTIDDAGLALLPGRTVLPAIYRSGGDTFLIAAKGRLAISDPAEWSATIPELDDEIASKIPSAGSGRFSAPSFLSTPGSTTTYLVSDTTRYAVATTADRTAIASSLGISDKAPSVPTAVIRAITAGPTIVKPGTVIRTSSSSSAWIVDGLNSRIPLSATQAKEFVGSTGARVVAKSVVTGYPVATGTALPGVTCNGRSYLAISGTLRKATPEVAAEYGSAYGFRALDASTCRSLSHAGSVGTLLSYNGAYYSVDNGERRTLTTAQYKEAVASGQVARPVSKYFLTLLTPAS